MSNNRLKDVITLNYLKGNKNVYRISSPDRKHHVLVNKNSLFQLVQSQQIPTKKVLDELLTKSYAGRTNKVNMVYHGFPYNYVFYSNGQYRPSSSLIPINKYVFKTLQGNYGIQNVRNPVGYTPKLMLNNVNKNTLTASNLRKLRSLRRQNAKNTAETLKKAKNKIRANANKRKANMEARKKYYYKIKASYKGRNNPRNFWVNSNGGYVARPPSNLVLDPTGNNNAESKNIINAWAKNWDLILVNRYRRA
jgi:hypothetical protein